MPLNATTSDAFIFVGTLPRDLTAEITDDLDITRHGALYRGVTHVYNNTSIVEVNIGFGRFYRFFSSDGGNSFLPLLSDVNSFNHQFDSALPIESFYTPSLDEVDRNVSVWNSMLGRWVFVSSDGSHAAAA